jgi:hypothetical protein
MKVKYLGLKVATVLATFAATPVVWAALAYPDWQGGDTGTAPDSPLDAPLPQMSPAQPRQVVIVPRLVDARTGQPLAAPDQAVQSPAAAPAPVAQPSVSSPPPQPQRQQPAAPGRGAATTRGS